MAVDQLSEEATFALSRLDFEHAGGIAVTTSVQLLVRSDSGEYTRRPLSEDTVSLLKMLGYIEVDRITTSSSSTNREATRHYRITPAGRTALQGLRYGRNQAASGEQRAKEQAREDELTREVESGGGRTP